jgi:hypothetical protein
VPWIFVLILVIVAGLVAAGGDRMGHKAARSKFRIGKLRPRHAATLISVVTGVLISLVTYTVVFAVWKDFRDALLHYREVKSTLAEVEGKLAGSQKLIDEADARRQQAVDDETKAQAEISKIQVQMIEITKSLSAAQKQLDDANVQISQSKGQLHDLNDKKTKLLADIDSYRARLDDLRGLVTQARSELETHQQGTLVLAKGTTLAYIPLDAGESAGLTAKLQVRIARLGESLKERGVSIDPASDAAAAEFVASYPYAAAKSVAIISAARNVVKGESVLLSFEARELTPLVTSGEVVMDVLVTSSSAHVRMKGQNEQQLDVPATFDENSIADFGVALFDIFDGGARKLGFLPDLSSGQIATPIGSLASVAGDLAKRERPYVIQFVAKQDATALDGLAGCEIYISNPPATP